MSTAPRSCSMRSAPSRTTVYSSNSGRWPGSSQPAGERMRATLTRSSPVFTRPTNSSISFGCVPAASTRAGESIRCGIPRKISRGEFRPGSASLRPMTATDDLLRNNESYAGSCDKGALRLPPAKKTAVVACMDARLDPARALGLQEGDAHVIRNAGGVVTDDAIRSLAISQRLLGTEEIILIHHTDCGMLTFKDDDLKAQIEKDTGIRPQFALEAFPDLDA